MSKPDSTEATDQVKPVRQPVPVKPATREILADGEFHSGDSILEHVRQKLGSSIQKVTVYGILKNDKEVERQGDEFRLVKITTGQSATA